MALKRPHLNRVNPLLCYSNRIMMCNRIIANVFRKHLRKFDVTDSQLSILFFVTKSGAVNQKGISDFLASEKSTVNRNIQRLIDKKLISINNHLLKTSEKGKDLLEEIIPSWEKAMEEVLDMIGQDGASALDVLHTNLRKEL